jgi:hypothetical protein
MEFRENLTGFDVGLCRLHRHFILEENEVVVTVPHESGYYTEILDLKDTK